MQTFRIVFVFTLLCAFAVGNDAAFHGDGSTVFALKSNHGVRLEKEKVVIRYASKEPWDSLELSAVNWNADATATLYNPSKKNVEVVMGLPNWRSFASEKDGDGQWAISELNVEADSEQGKIKFEDFNLARGQRPPTLPGNSPLFYDGGYRWTVKVPAQKRVSVRTRYSFGGFLSAGTIEALSETESPFHVPAENLFWKRSGTAPSGWKFGESRYRTVAYLVTPGKTWSGKIGSSDISIQLPPQMLPHLMVPQPSGFTVKDGFVHWKFTNWEPRRPVSIVQLIPPTQPGKPAACPIFDTVEQVSSWLEFARKNRYDRESINAVKNAIVAKHGYRFEESRWKKFFEGFPWYHAKSEVALSDLPEADRKMIGMLENYLAE